jgi:hypothetical protein
MRWLYSDCSCCILGLYSVVLWLYSGRALALLWARYRFILNVLRLYSGYAPAVFWVCSGCILDLLGLYSAALSLYTDVLWLYSGGALANIS